MTTFGRAMTGSTIGRFVPVLRQTAADIAQAYATASGA